MSELPTDDKNDDIENSDATSQGGDVVELTAENALSELESGFDGTVTVHYTSTNGSRVEKEGDVVHVSAGRINLDTGDERDGVPITFSVTNDGVVYSTTSGSDQRLSEWGSDTVVVVQDEPDTATDGGAEIRDAREVRNSDDAVRHYSADGTLYAYREGDEHAVVSNGREPATKWTKHVPAERTAVAVGEHLWTIPGNWEHRVSIDGAAEARYGIYHIPETGVDVRVSVPYKNYLADAWYGVQAVGELAVSYDDAINWNKLDRCIERLSDADDATDAELDALGELTRRQNAFENRFAEKVDMYAEGALFEGAHEPVSASQWTADPWGDHPLTVDRLVEDFLGISGDTLDAVLRALDNNGVIPSYPTVRVSVDSREGLPERYDTRALVEAGCSPAEAVDYAMVELDGLAQKDWAATRGVDPSTVSGNVKGARRTIER